MRCKVVIFGIVLLTHVKETERDSVGRGNEGGEEEREKERERDEERETEREGERERV